MKSIISQKIIYLVFALIFVTMLIFSCMSPLISDDYAFSFGPDGERVSSINDIFVALKYHRETANGRIIPHFFVYLMLMAPKGLFNDINAMMATLAVWSMYRFFRNNEDANGNLVVLLILVCSLWIFCPAFGDVALWLTGSCNYMWGLCLYMLLIYPFYNAYISGDDSVILSKDKKIKKILLAFLSFVVGAYSENGAVAIIFCNTLLTIAIWIKNKKIPVFAVVSIALSMIGFLTLLTAPSMAGRSTDSSIFDNAKVCLEKTKQYYIILFSAFAALFAVAIVNRVEKRILLSSAIIVVSGLASIAVFVFAAYLPARSFMILIGFTVLAVSVLLKELWNKREYKIISAGLAVIIVVFSFSFIYGTGDILSSFLQYRDRLQTIEHAKEMNCSTVELEQLASTTTYSAGFGERLYEDWYNDCIATYYGLEKVIPIVPNE